MMTATTKNKAHIKTTLNKSNKPIHKTRKQFKQEAIKQEQNKQL